MRDFSFTVSALLLGWPWTCLLSKAPGLLLAFMAFHCRCEHQLRLIDSCFVYSTNIMSSLRTNISVSGFTSSTTQTPFGSCFFLPLLEMWKSKSYISLDTWLFYSGLFFLSPFHLLRSQGSYPRTCRWWNIPVKAFDNSLSTYCIYFLKWLLSFFYKLFFLFIHYAHPNSILIFRVPLYYTNTM